ncbi:MAG TPA: filamentous hemagglutinin N-terminal domain-containing protein, partial [Accumulibacter sp.]|nr:filamentous hemagglutinin N-terminal domain-containing protein [Accumulibacter sp.]
MNKHLYRVVFNKKRGQMMAVMESAVGEGKTAGTTNGAGRLAPARWVRLRALSLSLLLALGLAAIRPDDAAAQAVAYKAAHASQQPTVLTAANGLPLVNIQTPGATGVSRNTYSQFDVQSQGLILNNSRTNIATQLGGWVQGNPWLAKGTARVILNEVVSGNPSVLNGYLEIAGDRAQLVIANPAGVTCGGCGFVNASRATLTTGTPLFDGDDLAGYRVTGGTVRIEGAGMDASRVDHADLIARAVEINAGLWAQSLKVTAGANQVDAAHTQAVPIAGSGTAPAFAIDVAQLGGMYANKILLVGTDAGVGVRNAGTIGAAAGEILVTAAGRLENRGTVISGDHPLTIGAQSVDNAGTLSTERNLQLSSQGEVVNTGLIHAGQELILDAAGPLTNRRGTLDGQRLDIRADSLGNDGGALRQSGTQALALTAAHVDNSSGALIGNLPPADTGGSGGTASSTAGGTVTAPTSAGDGAATVVPTAPSQLADGLIALRGDIVNTGAIAASGAVSLAATAGLTNAGTLTLDRLAVAGDSLRNRGAIKTTDARLETPLLDNSGGTLDVARTLDIAARDLLNAQGALRHTGAGPLALTLEGRLDN